MPGLRQFEVSVRSTHFRPFVVVRRPSRHTGRLRYIVFILFVFRDVLPQVRKRFQSILIWSVFSTCLRTLNYNCGSISFTELLCAMSSKEFEGDAGAPLPDFSTGQIRLDTVAPALGVSSRQQPDYLDYDQKGRGVVVTMFANTGVSYLLGIAGGGLYGFQKGISSTPSSKLKVQVNSVLNHCGRYGSKAGNTLGVFAVMYSLYEGVLDQVSTI